MQNITFQFRGFEGDVYELAMDEKDLCDAARFMSAGADATQIRFKVGAALRLHEGISLNQIASTQERGSRIILGTNTQFLTYEGAHAETMALDRALAVTRSFAQGEIATSRMIVDKIAVYSPDANAPLPPCGGCRQRIIELAYNPMEVVVIFFSKDGRVKKLIGAPSLLPCTFDLEKLQLP